MKRTLMAIVCIALCIPVSYAQDTQTEPMMREKKIEHHIGVQVNELIRQVFNFNNTTTTTNNNPYLLTYNINMIKSGWGLRVGAGCNFRSFANDDGINKTESDLNDVHVRLGVEKAFRLSNKWSTGVGLDGLYNTQNDYTNATTRSFDTVTTKTSSHISSFGGGVMTWLRFDITQKIQVGTEASFYYTTGNQKQEVSVTQRSQTGPFPTTKVTTTSKIDNNTANGVINLPVAFYLTVRF